MFVNSIRSMSRSFLLLLFFNMRISSGVQSTICWKDYLRSIVWPLILCQRSVDCNYVVHFWVFYSFYWSMSLFCYQSHSVLITVALEQIFRLGNVSPPTSFFSISWLSVSFAFPYELWNYFVEIHKIMLGFWLRLHWIYRCIWKELTLPNLKICSKATVISTLWDW